MIKIKKMNLEDFEKIKENLQKDFDDFWKPSILKSELESKDSIYIVAKKDEEIVGFAGIKVFPDDIEIMNIVTKKIERKKGIGKLLLDKIIEISRKIEKEYISLEVNEKNIIAISLYEKFGFKKIGFRKKYYNGIDNAIIMRKKIKNKFM